MTTLKIHITQIWNINLHLSFHSSEMRSEKPLVYLFPTNLFLSDHSWDRDRVSEFTVQTRIDTRWVDLPSLLVHWFLLHIPEWCISSPLDHIGVWGSLWIFGVGEWRRGCTWVFDYFYTIQKLVIHQDSPIFSFFK